MSSRRRKPDRAPVQAAIRSPDRRGMERAIRAFLAAAGMDLGDPNLAQTPQLVSEAWTHEFLDGYRIDAAAALGALYPAPPGSRGELVVVTNLRFHGMCPHHLLPYEGIAHLAYVPRRSVVGFGRLSALLDCMAHRLVLQEDVARDVARAMAKHLESPATACVLAARQACLRLRGERQRDAWTHAEAYEGALRKSGALRRELWTRIGKQPRNGNPSKEHL